MVRYCIRLKTGHERKPDVHAVYKMTPKRIPEHDRWSRYYRATMGREPRRLLLEALPYIKNQRGTALDLGAGDMTDSRYLLEQGFSVVAVDSSSASREASHAIQSSGLTTVVSTFEEFNFGREKYVLVNAQYSLPFSPPETFENVFGRLTDSLRSGGIFVGQLFGPRDGWAGRPGMSFFSRTEAERLLQGYEVLVLREEDAEGLLAAGGTKHWHVFHVIARKR
ncbi:MAG TPA: methyltransferase domain-containing protein [Thermodesulfobacteriota bacterium]|nr:methyltransferase domain-containing protein [Thermodesulfobacteriota bacterium]